MMIQIETTPCKRLKAFMCRNFILGLMVGSWYLHSLYTSTILSSYTNQILDVNADPSLIQTHQEEQIFGDLIWLTPPPQTKPRMIGWEDSFMKRFKFEHFDPTGMVRCENSESKTPYTRSSFLCNIPGYLPARYVPKNKPQKIPRTIFFSWRSRSVTPTMFLSIMWTLNINPEYELVFFDDNDIDCLVCALYPDMAPYFGRLQAGAARADVFRMIAIYHYGGIWNDADLTCFRHIDVPSNASVYGSVGGWSHIHKAGGVLNHWAMAFAQWHPVIGTTLNLIWDNLKDPSNPLVASKDAVRAEESETVRLTGPGPYQHAVHEHLKRAGCQPKISEEDGAAQFMYAMLKPEEHCNMTAFEEEFGTFVVTNTISQWGEVCLSKEIITYRDQYWDGTYDDSDGSTKILPEPQIDFCMEDAFQERANKTQAEWDFHVKKRWGGH